MSDYPRPAPPPPPKPYGPDRVVAGIIGLQALYSVGRGTFTVLRHPPPPSGPPAAYYLGVYALSLAIYAWILAGLARSRFWALMTCLVLCAMALAGHVFVNRAPWTVTTVTEALVVLYAVARLFALVGPHPVRRQDLYERS